MDKTTENMTTQTFTNPPLPPSSSRSSFPRSQTTSIHPADVTPQNAFQNIAVSRGLKLKVQFGDEILTVHEARWHPFQIKSLRKSISSRSSPLFSSKIWAGRPGNSVQFLSSPLSTRANKDCAMFILLGRLAQLLRITNLHFDRAFFPPSKMTLELFHSSQGGGQPSWPGRGTQACICQAPNRDLHCRMGRSFLIRDVWRLMNGGNNSKRNKIKSWRVWSALIQISTLSVPSKIFDNTILSKSKNSCLSSKINWTRAFQQFYFQTQLHNVTHRTQSQIIWILSAIFSLVFNLLSRYHSR